ncbi:MAG: potassium/proton antiporter [Alphaproteobacteria bacterium]|nr:MAG: potassium/proton antiporter [Alphaproteobacteria bacterium]TMJ97805.1 MAG: potassium/proton antiporter [Alphaproteobacteria bacterium]
MAALDAISIGILFGALLVLAGIMSSLVAMRFGAPLLLVFLIVGMLAGEGGPGGIQFDDVHTTYVVGSIALALILFDGGLRTRFATFRSVLAPAVTLATVGVLMTAALTAPVAKFLLGMTWTEALLVGAVVASTDAAAVFFLIHARGLRLRPRVGATLEVESGSNDPFAVLLTVILVEFLTVGDRSWQHVLSVLAEQAALGTLIGILGGHVIVIVLNRLALAQGLHAPFVTTSALVIFALASVLHASGFLAVYLAGLVVGNRPTRAHNTVVVFLDAVTWLAQIVMFVLLGLLVWPMRLVDSIFPALAVAVVLMFIARPAAVFACLAPFRFAWREKAFISWVGLRGAVGIFLASIPLLIGLPNAHLYFDIAFVVVLTSLLIQGWTIAAAARELHIALPRHDPLPRRVELDLPGQLEQEIVGYPVAANSPYLKRGLLPSWARPTLVVRDQKILSPQESQPVRPGDYVYVLAPPEKAQALDRFFVDMPPPTAPDPRLLGDFFVSGEVTLGALAEIYGLSITPEAAEITLADYFAEEIKRRPKQGDVVPLGPIALVAHRVTDGRLSNVGLRLAQEEEPPATLAAKIKKTARELWSRLG